MSDIAHADFDDPDLPEGETRKLDFAEVYSIIQQLMVAGNETTTKFLNETMRILIENPEWWEALETDTAGNVSGLSRKGCGFFAQSGPVSRRDPRHRHRGHGRAEGARIWVMFGAANRDDVTFDDGETFDPTRDNLKDHIAFGKGHHFCIGAPLSRLEGKVALEELVSGSSCPIQRGQHLRVRAQLHPPRPGRNSISTSRSASRTRTPGLCCDAAQCRVQPQPSALGGARSEGGGNSIARSACQRAQLDVDEALHAHRLTVGEADAGEWDTGGFGPLLDIAETLGIHSQERRDEDSENSAA